MKTLRIAVVLCGLTAFPGALAADQPTADIAATLDRLHAAAAKADSADYFALFAPDAVFIGTDASERWPIAAFRDYANPVSPPARAGLTRRGRGTSTSQQFPAAAWLGSTNCWTTRNMEPAGAAAC